MGMTEVMVCLVKAVAADQFLQIQRRIHKYLCQAAMIMKTILHLMRSQMTRLLSELPKIQSRWKMVFSGI